MRVQIAVKQLSRRGGNDTPKMFEDVRIQTFKKKEKKEFRLLIDIRKFFCKYLGLSHVIYKRTSNILYIFFKKKKKVFTDLKMKCLKASFNRGKGNLGS